MGQGISDIRQDSEVRNTHAKNKDMHGDDFVLEKNIFNNVFEKDIRRIFIYKKAERLAKAIQLITPAFVTSVSLKNRMDTLAVAIVDAAIQSSALARIQLSQELLALSSLLSMARTGGLLSAMNAEIISNEARVLLHEVAAYEEPKLFFDDAPTLSDIAKGATRKKGIGSVSNTPFSKKTTAPAGSSGGVRVKDINQENIKDRRDAVLSIIKTKGSASIKDISSLIRDVSEKTIQRELISLINDGVIAKKGERRWSTYSAV